MKALVHALPLPLITAMLAAPAAAQDSSGDQAIIVTAQRENATEVRSGGSAGVLGDKAAEDLPFAIRSFGESLILNQQPLTLGEVLENDPTIRTTYGFGNAAEQFIIRGFPLYSDDVGMNGLYGITPRQIVAPELYDSVQVLNGSTAFLNGAAPGGTGLGGSVNLTLKRADRDLTRVTLGYVSQEHFGGSFDVARRFGGGGEWGVRVNGAYRDGEVAIDREDRRAQVLGAAIDYDSGPFRGAIDLAYQEVRVDGLRPKVTIGASIPAVPDSDYNHAQDFTYTEMRDFFGTLALEYDLAESVMLYAKAGARDGREEGIYGGLTIADAATGAADGSALFVPRSDNNEAVEAGVRFGFGSSITHEVNFGGNLSWQTERNAYDFRSSFATNLYAAPQVDLPPSAFTGGDLDDPFPVSESRLASLFLSDTIGLWGDRVLLTGGVRWQQMRKDNDGDYDGDFDLFYDDEVWTPVVGLVVKPAEGLSLYANRIEALQSGPVAPLEEELVNRGQPLAPRKSTQYEIGGKLDLARALFATLALYRIERPGEGTFTNEEGELEFGYIGDQRHQGVELSLIGELSPGLRLISGLAYTDAEFDNGLAVAGVAEFAANANVEWDLPYVEGLTLTGRASYTGEQQANAANTLQLDDWITFDVGARYVFVAAERPWTLRLGVDNVFDEAYWASAFDVFSAALLQGRPRTVNASLSVDF